MVNKEELLNFIKFIKEKTGYCTFNSSRTEILTYCPQCEKSRFNSRNKKGHLYISTDTLVFNCFKCNFSGFISKFLREYDATFVEYFTHKDFKDNLNNFHKNKSYSMEIPTDIVNNDMSGPSYEIKKSYIMNRIHKEDSKIEDVNNVVWDIDKFIKDNKIVVNDNIKKMIPYLKESFVGFLTNRKTLVVLRNIEQNDFRFFNFHLGKKSYFKDFYGFYHNKINKNVDTVILGEGIFDILNAYQRNILNINLENTFWAASLNNRYDNTLQSVLDYCKIVRADVIILSDANITSESYKHIINIPIVNSLNVYWNSKGKDFGEKDIEIYKKVFK